MMIHAFIRLFARQSNATLPSTSKMPNPTRLKHSGLLDTHVSRTYRTFFLGIQHQRLVDY